MLILLLFAACTVRMDTNPGDESTEIEETRIIVKKEVSMEKDPNYYKLATYGEDSLIQVVVEIPAGTNHKIEYDPDDNTFPCNQKNGRDRIVQYLPYLGNYGFIPSTLMDRERGGDGDALDVLVLGESIKTKSVINCRVIGVLQLLDKGEKDDKIIAVPAHDENQIIAAIDVEELAPSIKRMIETWFGNYKGPGKMEVIGWQNAVEARKIVNYWKK